MNNSIDDLITGEQALEALSKGEDVLHISKGMNYSGHWSDSEDTKNLTVFEILSNDWSFKLKPKTMLLNCIEIPAPFEPKQGELYYYISPFKLCGYDLNKFDSDSEDRKYLKFGVWRTEDEIKKVVEAQRKVFGGL